MSDSADIFDLSEEQIWGLENGKEVVLNTKRGKMKIRGENYYD